MTVDGIDYFPDDYARKDFLRKMNTKKERYQKIKKRAKKSPDGM